MSVFHPFWGLIYLFLWLSKLFYNILFLLKDADDLRDQYNNGEEDDEGHVEEYDEEVEEDDGEDEDVECGFQTKEGL